MSYKEVDRAKLQRQSGRQSIELALEGKWQEAIDANKDIVENFPNDVNAYNRLGRAYTELGDYTQARAAYEKALVIDAYNSIAKKNLSRLSLLGEAGTGHEGHKIEPQQFIEEIGKAGVVNLTHVASAEILAKMVAGEAVVLKVEGSNLTVQNDNGELLGQVGSKTGQRLVKLMEGGNKYTASVVSASEESVTVIIREVFQDPSQAGKFSFSPRESEGLRPYVAGWLGERIVRRELEEEKGPDSRGFIIVGGDEAETDQEILVDEPGEDTEEVDEE